MSDKKLNILISNDDGVHAPGIHILADVLAEIADIKVVAPDRNRSGASHSLTLTRPLRVQTLDNQFVGVQGTPTDCVHLALTGLYENYQPDIVVSGINHGANLGDDVLYSGTVAAAIEGRHLGLPAIAVSLIGEEEHHYKTAAIIARNMVQLLKAYPIASTAILNVNVPDVSYQELKGYSITRLGTRHSAEPTIRGTDPRGSTIYWVGPAGAEDDAGKGTDFYAIKNKQVSITPLHIDLTSYESFSVLNHWAENLSV